MEASRVMTKRCHTCERKFGLIRHSYGFKQFCRKKCLVIRAVLRYLQLRADSDHVRT